MRPRKAGSWTCPSPTFSGSCLRIPSRAVQTRCASRFPRRFQICLVFAVSDSAPCACWTSRKLPPVPPPPGRIFHRPGMLCPLRLSLFKPRLFLLHARLRCPHRLPRLQPVSVTPRRRPARRSSRARRCQLNLPPRRGLPLLPPSPYPIRPQPSRFPRHFPKRPPQSPPRRRLQFSARTLSRFPSMWLPRPGRRKFARNWRA